MKSLILVTVLAAMAAAHWPYADLKDKFRISSIAVAGNNDHHSGAESMYSWIFYPTNNQRSPTFQLRFPSKMVTYTLQLTHASEVKSIGNGGFELVPNSIIDFAETEWFASRGNWYYDESFGEVIELDIAPNPITRLDEVWDISVAMKIFPDTQDDIVDITLKFNNYQFVGTGEVRTFYAVFFKLTSSSGTDSEDFKNLPLSVDWDMLRLEVNADVMIDDPQTNHTRRSIQAERAARQVHNAKRPNAVRAAKRRDTLPAARAVLRSQLRHEHAAHSLDTPTHSTTGQLWYSGGYIACIVGLMPGDFTGGRVWADLTLGIRSLRKF